VPQGSILGPVLFVIFIYDTSQSWSSTGVTIKLFADDAKLYTVVQNDFVSSVELLSCLDAILERAKIWQLKPALAKCTPLCQLDKSTLSNVRRVIMLVM
jgi:hypothetical protein